MLWDEHFYTLFLICLQIYEYILV
ncbi:MAG: hypothetical protein RL348_1027, partial [Bacteroidota bacterium]